MNHPQHQQQHAHQLLLQNMARWSQSLQQRILAKNVNLSSEEVSTLSKVSWPRRVVVVVHAHALIIHPSTTTAFFY